MKQTNCQIKTCRNYGRYCRQHLGMTVPVKKEVNPISDKKKELDKKYAKIRKQYLTAYPFCEAKIEGCTKVSVEIHHKAGKASGELYLNSDLFLAVCRSCHQIITKNSAWAIQQGLSVSRHKKRTA